MVAACRTSQTAAVGTAVIGTAVGTAAAGSVAAVACSFSSFQSGAVETRRMAWVVQRTREQVRKGKEVDDDDAADKTCERRRHTSPSASLLLPLHACHRLEAAAEAAAAAACTSRVAAAVASQPCKQDPRKASDRQDQRKGRKARRRHTGREA